MSMSDDVSATNSTYNFLAAMMYTQMFNVLANAPTKIRVYGSKRIADRNVGVQIARKRGGVKVVSMKLPVPLQAVRILSLQI